MRRLAKRRRATEGAPTAVVSTGSRRFSSGHGGGAVRAEALDASASRERVGVRLERSQLHPLLVKKATPRWRVAVPFVPPPSTLVKDMVTLLEEVLLVITMPNMLGTSALVFA